MFNSMVRTIIAASVLTAGYMTFQSQSVASSMTQATYAAVGNDTSVPYGWVDFCRRYAGECPSTGTQAMDINLTPKAMKAIERINKWVNSNIEAVSDKDHWNVVDQWDYPTDGKGDCEDFVLLKRKLLAEEGFPIQALLVTVVKDQQNEGHAVLTLKTNRGEYVLDNMKDGVKPWNQTGYRFVKRQSQTDANTWVQIGEPTSAPMYVSR